MEYKRQTAKTDDTYLKQRESKLKITADKYFQIMKNKQNIRIYFGHKAFAKIAAILFLLIPFNGYSCVNCNSKVQIAIRESVENNHFLMFSAFIALAIVVGSLIYITIRNLKIINYNFDAVLSTLPLKCTAIILGIGLGGFADGIVLHQILQWHEMLSNKIPVNTLVNKSVNMFWDGIFHLFTLLTTLVGIYLFWKLLHHVNINKSKNLLTGGLLAGWGIFNIIEGTINHHILKLHNVRELSPNTDWWNYGFLLFGISLICAGWFIMRKAEDDI